MQLNVPYSVHQLQQQQQVYHPISCTLLSIVFETIGAFITLELRGILNSGSVAEWLACWTQAQKGLGSNSSRDAVG